MRVLVTGGRDFTDHKFARDTLLAFIKKFGLIDELIHGDAPGADTVAGFEAQRLGIKVIAVPADWEGYGKAAGILRNQKMVEMKPDYCLPFPGGTGTKDCCRRCLHAKIPFFIIKKPLL